MNDPKLSSDQTPQDETPDSINSAYDGNPDNLHDLFAGEAGTEEDDPLAALRNDPNYAALIRDLELIAVEARRLFEPAQETPSDTVWEKIQQGMVTKPTDA